MPVVKYGFGLVILPVLFAPLLVGVGCAPSSTDMLHFLREHEHEVSAIEYRVGIPDAIGISSPRILEIDGEAQRIQPDGKINLRLLGEVKVVRNAHTRRAKLYFLRDRIGKATALRKRRTPGKKTGE